MAGRIPPEFIDQLLGRIDIVEVIDTRVRLKKAGKDFQACCPFHTEKTPSFTVSQDKQFYHCFGCGAHGTAIGFLMDYEHLSFPEAVEELASQAGMEVPRVGGQGPGPEQSTAPLLALLERADTHFRQQLRHHPQAGRAIDYLKGRGLSGEIAKTFGLGFAPPGWDNLLHAMGDDPATVHLLEQAGLAVAPQPDRHYDRFRDRIMFPIRDRRGRIIGFGGRVLGDDKPKYLNSPETPVFHKGRELYGLYQARKALRHIDRLLIVEGYMDVIALAQFGIRYAVATLGTATTPDHLERLFRTTSELVFCFDGDRAGREAAWKALNVALPETRDGRSIRFLFLPEGEDPDTLVRKTGTGEFERLIAASDPIEEFLEKHSREGINLRGLAGPAYLVETVKPLLEKIPAGLTRRNIALRLADVAGVHPSELGLKRITRPMPRSGPTSRKPQRMTPVRHAIAILVQHPELAAAADTVPGDWRRLAAPGIGLMGELLELIRSQPTLKTAAILERWRDTDYGPHLDRLATYDLTAVQDGLELELSGALERLNSQVREQDTEALFRKDLSQMTQEEKEQLKDLFGRGAVQEPDDGGVER